MFIFKILFLNYHFLIEGRLDSFHLFFEDIFDGTLWLIDFAYFIPVNLVGSGGTSGARSRAVHGSTFDRTGDGGGVFCSWVSCLGLAIIGIESILARP